VKQSEEGARELERLAQIPRRQELKWLVAQFGTEESEEELKRLASVVGWDESMDPNPVPLTKAQLSRLAAQIFPEEPGEQFAGSARVALPNETEDPTHTLLDLASRILPRKIVAEYIGDREEVLRRMAAEDCPRWKVRLEAASCVFWAVVFTLRKFVAPAAILGALSKWLGMGG
jgi:hypothetical protein